MDAIPPPISPPPQSFLSARGNDKIWSMFCHLSVFLGIGLILVPLVVYLAMRHESEYVAANAREALNFHISVMIYFLCCIPLCFVLVGFFFAAAVGICMYIFAIIATIKASDGGCYHYPLTLRLIH
jgi:uncharacterized Tic20 family protein